MTSESMTSTTRSFLSRARVSALLTSAECQTCQLLCALVPRGLGFQLQPRTSHTCVMCVPIKYSCSGLSAVTHTHTHFPHLNVVNLSSRSCKRGCFSVLMQQPDSLGSVWFFVPFSIFVFRCVCI